MNAENARIWVENARVHLFARRADLPLSTFALDTVCHQGYVLTPGCYVDALRQEEDGEPFEENMGRLTATLREQQAEAAKLDAAIAANLKELGYGG